MVRLVEAIAGYAAKIGVKLTIFSTEYPVARTKRMTGKMPGHISLSGHAQPRQSRRPAVAAAHPASCEFQVYGS